LAWAKPQQQGKPAVEKENPVAVKRSADYYPSMDPERLGSRPETFQQPPSPILPTLSVPSWNSVDPNKK